MDPIKKFYILGQKEVDFLKVIEVNLVLGMRSEVT